MGASLMYRKSSKNKTHKKGKIKVFNIVKGQRSLRFSEDTCCARVWRAGSSQQALGLLG